MQVLLQTPTPDMRESLDFYTKLGFHRLSEEDPRYFSDGTMVLEINPERFARAGVKLYTPDWSETLQKLREITVVREMEGSYLLSSPCGTWIYLAKQALPPFPPQTDLGPTTLGKHAGLSLEMVDAELGKKIWKTLGFEKETGDLEANGYTVLQNSEGLGVSIMVPMSCPHLFFNPSLTYFNSGKNPEHIVKIREAGIPFAEEVTIFNPDGEVDNVILKDPGGFGFFVFND